MIKPLFKKAIIIASMLLASLLGMANSSKGDDILISPKHNELPGGPHMPPAAVPFYAELERIMLRQKKHGFEQNKKSELEKLQEKGIDKT